MSTAKPNSWQPGPGTRSTDQVEDHLIAHLTAITGRPRTAPGQPATLPATAGHWRYSQPASQSATLDIRALVVAYARIPDPEQTDPRTPLLAPTSVHVINAGDTLAAGRAPRDATHLLAFTEPDETADPAMPAAAIHLAYTPGGWQVTNHTSRPEHRIALHAPGYHHELGHAGAVTLSHRMTFISAVGRSVTISGAPVACEHRLTVLSPALRTPPPPAPVPRTAATSTVGMPGALADLDHGSVRMVAAYAYPELLGVGWRPADRNAMMNRLLGQPLDHRNDRTLTTLRARLREVTALPLNGRLHSAQLLALIAAGRNTLAPTIRDLHAEWVTQVRQARVRRP
jgi:hypothetical protein